MTSQAQAIAVDLARSRRDSDHSRQRERLENLVLRMPIGVVVIDRRYDIQTINNAARRLFGVHGPAIGEDFVHLAQGVPSQQLRAAIDEALRAPATLPEPTLLQVSTPDGQAQYLRVLCYPEVHEDVPIERPETVIVLAFDGTADTGRQQELAEQVQHLAEQQQLAAQHAAQLSEAHRRLLEANQDLSMANAELRGANEELQVASEESQAATEEVETLNEELQATNEELETLNEELQATVEELNTTNDDLQSRSVELQELALNLEEQRRSSEAERARLQAVLASMSDAMVVVYNGTTPTLTNAAFDRLFPPGAALLDAGGEPLADDASPLGRAARGEPFRMRFGIDSVDGRRRMFEASGEPIDGPGNLPGGVVIIRDVTER
jgi:two-component system CheB/CheR fusion protein